MLTSSTAEPFARRSLPAVAAAGVALGVLLAAFAAPASAALDASASIRGGSVGPSTPRISDLQADAQQARGAATAADRETQRRAAEIARAVQGYQSALRSLSSSTSASISARNRADDAASARQAAESAQARSVRAYYMLGGQIAVYAELLDVREPQDLLTGVNYAERVIRARGEDADEAVARSRAAAQQAATANATAEAQVSTVAEVQRHWDDLQALLKQARDRARSLAERAGQTEAAVSAARAAQAAGRAVAEAEISAHTSAASVAPRPGSAGYQALYTAAAATCPGLHPAVLSAIGQVESGHGRNAGTSSAGAQGPMQFMPATFAIYAVDGNRDGRTDIHDAADSIYTAARYLCASGAGNLATLPRAIWHYNHAQWYVDLVLGIAEQIDPSSVPPRSRWGSATAG